MTLMHQLEADNAALREQLMQRDLADIKTRADAAEAARTQAAARDEAEHAADQNAALEKVRVGAWSLHLLRQQIDAGGGAERFEPTVPAEGWPPGQSPADFGLLVGPKVAADVAELPAFQMLLKLRKGKL